MPANSNTLTLSIEVDDKGTMRVRQFATEVEKASGKVGSAFEGAASRIENAYRAASGYLALLAGSQAFAAVNRLVQLASDLEEMTSKFNVVFKGQETVARRAAETLVRHYGLSTREARQYLAAIQDLLVPMGVQAELAARLALEVNKLSADLGRFNNLPTAQVMADIQSALVGNYETMKKYGVVLNEETVQRQALNLGLARTKDELTAGAKAYAAFTIMVADSKAALGDKMRTMDSYANQLRAYQAALEDTGAALGQAILPVATAIVGKLREIATGLRDLINPDTTRRLEVQAQAALAAVRAMEQPVARGFYQSNPKAYDRFMRQYALAHRLRESAENERAAAEAATRPGAIDIPAARRGDFAARYGGAGKTGKEERWEKPNWMDAWAASLEPDSIDSYSRARAAHARLLEEEKRDRIALEKEVAEEMLRAREALYGPSAEGSTARLMEEQLLRAEGTIAEMRRRREETLRADQQRMGESLVQISQRTAEAMEASFANLFFDAFTGKLDDAEDYFRAFSKSILGAWSEMLGQMMKEALFGKAGGSGIGGLFGWLGGLFGAGGGAGAAAKAVPYMPAMARGGVFGPSGIERFGRGGVVTRPTIFPFARGVGLMGEAGWEGILPLARTPSGDLGVKSTGGGGATVVHNVYHIQAIDTQSFVDAARRSGAVPMLAAENIVGNGLLRQVIASSAAGV